MPTYRVRIEHGGVITQVRNMTFLDCAENNILPAYFEKYAVDYETAYADLINQTGGKVTASRAITLFWIPAFDGTAGASYFDSLGLTNRIVLGSNIIGDKLIFNNGNYIEITNAMAFSDSGAVMFRYCLSNGVVVATCSYYGNISKNNVNGGISTQSIPWYCGNDSVGLESFGVAKRRFDGYNDSVMCSYNGYRVGTSDWSFTDANTFKQFFEGIKPIDLEDPYVYIDDSAPSGLPSGGGLPTSDAVGIPTLPSISVADTGFITLFNPTLAQIKDLASYMWSGLFDIATYKKLFADPMDCILGLNLLPVPIPNGGIGTVEVGNISTDVSMTLAQSQWVEVDCGTLNIGTPYDNYLDFSPYTKYSIYLPYIGTVNLSADDCVGKTLHLVYHVDVLSCACVAYLKCGDSVLYQFTGSCGYSIPITGDNFRQMIQSIIAIAGAVGGAVMGGMTAPLVVGAVASTANNVMNSKVDVKRAGSIGSSAGIMGIQKPYLILEFPNPCKPEQQYKYTGYPSFVTVKVGDLSGYTEFDSVILDKVTCDEDEKALIEEILKGGVYL